MPIQNDTTNEKQINMGEFYISFNFLGDILDKKPF
jgi:hypothetical protein